MSRWVNSFNRHAFINTLRDFIQKLNENQLPEGTDENTSQEYGRLSKVVNYLEMIVSGIDPELISSHSLNEMQGNLQNALNEYNTFISNKNVGHLQNANSNIDHVLNVISRTFVYYKTPTKGSLRSILKSYSEILEQHRDNYKKKTDTEVEKVVSSTSNIQEKLNSLQTGVDALQNEIKNIQNQAQTQLAEFNTQFQASLNSNRQSFNESQRDNQHSFSTLLSTAESEYENQRDSYAQKVETHIQEVQLKIDNEFALLAITSGKIIEVLEKYKLDAETVFGVVQNTVQAGAHKTYADTEKTTANKFRYFAIFFMVLSAGVLIFPEIIQFLSVESASQYAVNWEKLLIRLPISAVLFVPAFYLARESSKHRQNEFQNRQKELTLRTIDPYLALLKDEKRRDELKGKIAQGIFGESNFGITANSDTSDVISEITNLVNNLAKYLKK